MSARAAISQREARFTGLAARHPWPPVGDYHAARNRLPGGVSSQGCSSPSPVMPGIGIPSVSVTGS